MFLLRFRVWSWCSNTPGTGNSRFPRHVWSYIHLELMAIISQFPAAFSPPSFWCGFCPHVCCPQDFNMPFHLQHLVHIQEETKKVDVCIRLAKNIPQILRIFGSCSIDQNLGPGSLFSVNESIKGEFYLEILHPSTRLRFGYR